MLKSSQISSTSIILQQIQVLNPTASGPKFSILSNPSIIAQERKALKPTTTAPNSIKVSNSVTTPTSGFVQKALSQGNHVRGLNLELGNYSADIFGEAYVGPQKYSNQSLAYSPPPHEHLLARGDTYLTASPASTQWQNFPNGYGQWDDQHKDMVIRAWNIAKIMTAAVLASMQAIGSGSPNYQLFTETNPICKNTKAATAEFYNCYRTFIAQSNLAYGQLFGADPENIGLITQNWKSLHDNLEVQNAPNRGNQLLYLSMSSVVTNIGTGQDECAGGTIAFVIPIKYVKEMQGPGVQPPIGATIMNFCDPFFKLPRMEELLSKLVSDRAGNQAQICNIDNLDSSAQVMLHEMTHLPWTINTNLNGKPTDRRGFMTVISYNTAQSGLQRMSTKSFGSQNADSYAWQGVYHYFNNLDLCQGVTFTGGNSNPSGCTDVYPKSQQSKWVNYQWNNYPTGNN
ncbi:hypothetical protein MMC32_008476 [Xylographa parallela]|nr:hypothetical protein [Xylographa parallela]